MIVNDKKKKRLLVCTQAVDLDDPVLGFFHRWIEEFSRHFDALTVVCLKEGRRDLPANVRVFSLGKERGRVGKIRYALRFLSLIWRLRREYDAVFVHMNPEYFIVAGWFWKLFGKKTALWYTHKAVNPRLLVATLFANRIFTASKESFRLASRKVRIMGHGIDTDFFKPDPNAVRGEHWLSVGRLMESKRHDLAIRTAASARRPLRIAGEGPERERLEVLARELGTEVSFLGPLSREQLRDEYRTATLLIHRSETGSLDKVVLEAAACGCPVDTTNSALAALPLSPNYVQKHHSLQALIPRILSLYENPAS